MYTYTQILHDGVKDTNWEALSELERRRIVAQEPHRLHTAKRIVKYEPGYFYCGLYITRPGISSSGKIYFKTKSDTFGVYKNGKFYGDMRIINEGLAFVPDLAKFRVTSYNGSIPKSVLSKIINGEINTEDQMWQLVAKASYKINNATVARYCKRCYIPFAILKLVADDWEKVSECQDTRSLTEMITLAYIAGEKVSVLWSISQMTDAINRLSFRIRQMEAETKDSTLLWGEDFVLDEDGEKYSLINSEKQLFLKTDSRDIYDWYRYEVITRKVILFMSDSHKVRFIIDNGVTFDDNRSFCPDKKIIKALELVAITKYYQNQ